MTTEQKIREAFEKWLKSNGIEDEDMFRFAVELDPFTAGYLALLNWLIGVGACDECNTNAEKDVNETNKILADNYLKLTCGNPAPTAVEMQKLIDQLNEPDKHFPGNFDTPKQANALLMCLCQEAAEAIKAQYAEIERLRDIESEMLMIGVERAKNQFQDEISSQAAEIDVLKIAHEAHQTSNLKMLAILKQQAFDLLKYRALCDQMGDALKFFEPFNGEFEDLQITALEAWRTMK